MSAAAPGLSDVELARHIADTAGRILVELQNSGLFEGKTLGKAGDRTANAFIMEALKTNRPDDAILSEEEQDNAERLQAKRVWIVDPLDGTREYGENRTDWAVHIALSIDGEPSIGAVALPGFPLTLCTGQPLGQLRPAAVAIAAGLHASRADGTPLRYNNADIYLPDLLICRKEHASQVFEALRIAEPVMG